MCTPLHQITPAHRHGEALGLRMMSINAASFVMPMLFGTAGVAVGVAGGSAGTIRAKPDRPVDLGCYMEPDIFKSFSAHSDEHAARQMAAYMKNRFPFLGIHTPLRRALAKDFLRQLCQSEAINWPFVVKCFEHDEREYHYLALDYLVRVRTRIPRPDIQKIERFIQTKS